MSDTFQNDLIRKKRLGQFFSGTRLARLLAALARSNMAISVIDPMCGDGDMLEACQNERASATTVVGIEIDPLAHQAAAKRLVPSRSSILLGDCFSPVTLQKLPRPGYKLVITNPPYVRYQTLSQPQKGALCLPSADDIRGSLLASLELFTHLDALDRYFFGKMISGYSGLSDAAVPSWILCALLTEVGGKLAMVVPEAWLSRDYAKIIQYMLLRWFKIICVVEDSNAVWFSEALVKTTLLVAERIGRRDSAFSWEDETYMLVHVPSTAMTPRSVVGGLFPGVLDPERQFADLVSLPFENTEAGNSLFAYERIPLRLKAANLLAGSKDSRWMAGLESVSAMPGLSQSGRCEIPGPLASWLGDSECRFNSMTELQVNVSQGLRTGANQFFYIDLIGQTEEEAVVAPHPAFGFIHLRVPKDSILPVLRKQSELGNAFRLETSKLSGRVLALQTYVLPEDSRGELALAGIKTATMMSPALAEFVRRVAKTNVGAPGAPEYIPQLTAVRTNVRTSPPRFWYMLPDFAPRHRPELFLARVNNGHPAAYLNAPEPVLIDANFSTLWLDATAAISKLALLAILNSSWCIAAMELLGSVMGGGALKLEATHLRRLPIPAVSSAAWRALGQLGGELISPTKPSSVRSRIDETIVGEIFKGPGVEQKLAALASLLENLLSKRNHTKP
jgi:hypothetical protein